MWHKVYKPFINIMLYYLMYAQKYFLLNEEEFLRADMDH